ncbi:hypothetical protein GQ42DRAFT_51245 [Ramicandelaber brevisporus]|nr:hypothetical protein GQ42DRAFT_51245 [Ramicandelaber brevisporus]
MSTVNPVSTMEIRQQIASYQKQVLFIDELLSDFWRASKQQSQKQPDPSSTQSKDFIESVAVDLELYADQLTKLQVNFVETNTKKMFLSELFNVKLFENSEDDIAQLSHERRQGQVSLENLHQTVKTQRTTMESLCQQLMQKREIIVAKQSEALALANEIEQLERELAEVDAELAAEETSSQSKMTLEEMNHQIESKSKQMKELHAESQRMANTTAVLTNDVEQAEQQVIMLRRKRDATAAHASDIERRAAQQDARLVQARRMRFAQWKTQLSMFGVIDVWLSSDSSQDSKAHLHILFRNGHLLDIALDNITMAILSAHLYHVATQHCQLSEDESIDYTRRKQLASDASKSTFRQLDISSIVAAAQPNNDIQGLVINACQMASSLSVSR